MRFSHLHALAPLSYPVRLLVVCKYLGFVLLVSTALLLAPLVVSLFWQEYNMTLRYGIVGGLFLVLGFLSLAIPQPKALQSNEAYTVIALAFIVGSFSMTYPIMGSGMNFIDSWFESVSGLTTTGLSLADLEAIDQKTFFFARSWMQWYGGLGIIIFGIGLAFLPGTLSKAFVKRIVYSDDKIENSKVFARKILLIYSLLTVLGFGLLLLTGIGGIKAAELTFSAISTGGVLSLSGWLGEPLAHNTGARKPPLISWGSLFPSFLDYKSEMCESSDCRYPISWADFLHLIVYPSCDLVRFSGVDRRFF
ncbi:MAG: hypothetical protein JJU12_06900 [Chlamydiales bacterium]|nr:hypothetical protein [Chlamydiales bacterium]